MSAIYYIIVMCERANILNCLFSTVFIISIKNGVDGELICRYDH